MSSIEVVEPESSGTTEQKIPTFNEYKLQSPSPEEVAKYESFDSDEDETAFGTTISDDDYMGQYKKHNRMITTGKLRVNSSLLSPIIDTKGHVAFSASTDMNATHAQHSITDNSTVHAMAQAAKYYNELHFKDDKQSQVPLPNAENFECRTLEYGQNALFHKEKEQYFADISKNARRHVLINLHVSRITEIDTVLERFRCKFWISFSWLPTFSEWTDHQLCKKLNTLSEWRPLWIPNITFPELLQNHKMIYAEKPNTGMFTITPLYGKEEEIGYDPSYCKFIKCRLECDLTFSTGFFLINFPVDCQDLPISINETSAGCVFVAEKRKRSFASVHTMSSVMEEWEFLNMMIEIGQLVTGINESSLAQLKVRLKMQRRYEVYLWNVVFFMALISGLTLCSFAVDDADLGERLAIIITLLLTSVAYQSSVFSTLPNVPYLTLLDKYIVTSFVFMTLVTVETAMLGTKYADNDTHNNLLFAMSSTIFIGYHVVFLLVASFKKRFELKKLHMPAKTMAALYSQSRERMQVEWKSETKVGSNWKIYTKYPKKLITKAIDGKDIYASKKKINKRKSKADIF